LIICWVAERLLSLHVFVHDIQAIMIAWLSLFLAVAKPYLARLSAFILPPTAVSQSP
jgi:hypothetical protein